MPSPRIFLKKNPGYELSRATVIGDFWAGKWLVQQARAPEKGLLHPDQANQFRILAEIYGITSQTQVQKRWVSTFEKAGKESAPLCRSFLVKSYP